MTNPLDDVMTPEKEELIRRNVEVSLIRAGIGLKSIREEFLSSEYQLEVMKNVLSSTPSILQGFLDFDSSLFAKLGKNSNLHPRLRNIESLDLYFEGEKDSFELRVAKSALLPTSQALYCHGSTLYLSGVLSKPFWLSNFGEDSAKNVLTRVREKAENLDLKSDLELRIQRYDCFNELNHSNLVRNELVFDRLYNGAKFRIIPESEYSPHDGVGFSPHNVVSSFKTSFQKLYDADLDKRLYDDLCR